MGWHTASLCLSGGYVGRIGHIETLPPPANRRFTKDFLLRLLGDRGLGWFLGKKDWPAINAAQEALLEIKVYVGVKHA